MTDEAQQRNGSQEIAANTPPTIDKDKVVNYMDAHAGDVSTERCAAYC